VVQTSSSFDNTSDSSWKGTSPPQAIHYIADNFRLHCIWHRYTDLIFAYIHFPGCLCVLICSSVKYGIVKFLLTIMVLLTSSVFLLYND